MKFIHAIGILMISSAFLLAAGSISAAPRTRQQAPVRIPLVKAPTDSFVSVIPLQIPIAWMAFPLQPGNMAGWTVITSGASRGGAALVKAQAGRNLIMTRSGNGGLYAATFDISHIEMIESSRWLQVVDTIYSDPVCTSEPIYTPSQTWIRPVCAWLGQSGNAEVTRFGYDDAKKIYNIETVDWKGSQAGSPPQFATAPKLVHDVDGLEAIIYNMVVWDGGAGVFQIIAGSQNQPDGVDAYEHASDWEKKGGVYLNGVECGTSPDGASPLCVAPTGDSHLRIVELGAPLMSPVFGATSPAPPEPMAGRPAVVRLSSGRFSIVVRGKSGNLFQTFYNPASKSFDGAWKNQGGYVANGATPTCESFNDQPVCVIQGNDGRLYAKALATSAGL